MLTFTKQCQPQAAYYWQVAKNAACHFNIFTDCPTITFQILKTEITTVAYCALWQYWVKIILTISDHKNKK